MAKPFFKTSGSAISSFSTVIGITLVLTMLGAFSSFLIIANSLSHYIRGQHNVHVFLKDQASESEIQKLKQFLQTEDYVDEIAYVSKEQAAKVAAEEVGQDFVDFLGYNPVPASLDIRIRSSFNDMDKLDEAVQSLKSREIVEDVEFQKGLMQKINENSAKIGFGLLILGVLLMIIAIVLINSTIELAIFSQRFIIKSMQLVGATHWFIQKPFLRRALFYAIVSSILALAILSLLFYSFRNELVDAIKVMNENNGFLISALVIVLSGILVSWISTAIAVRRFIRLRQGQLF
ncbi:MAG: permease-like cell division protein FtsX [Flavobacteriales bacterium]|nr:permease-like cell division protein FtsX [Flavobacteriales bacterium]